MTLPAAHGGLLRAAWPPVTRRSWLVVAAVAFGVRLSLVLASGGLGGTTSYDPGVYYAASATLLAGRLPYRDYTLIHPPGITLLLSPFAELGRLSTSHVGFMTAMLASMLVGALDAGLVARIAVRLGFGTRGAWLGGLFYALCLTSAGSEYATRLEPFGNLFVLLAVHAWAGRRPRPATWLMVGLASGAALSIKIWYVVPALVLLLACLRSGRRAVGFALAGLLAACAVIDGPFFVLAPSDMWRSVVVDQLGRTPFNTSLVLRLTQLSGLDLLSAPDAVSRVLVAGFVATLLVLLVRAAQVRDGFVPCLLLITELATLLWSPSWFPFYADFAATGGALVLAAAAAPRTVGAGRSALAFRRLAVPALATAAVVLTAALTAWVELLHPIGYTHRYPAAALRAAVAGDRCVLSDSPVPLIELDVLNRDLRNGCPQWVDVTGRTYGIDRLLRSSGVPYSRRDNPRWQADLRRYFSAADAIVLSGITQAGISPATLRWITRGGVVAADDGVVVYEGPEGVADRRGDRQDDAGG